MQTLHEGGIALILWIQGLLHPSAGGIWTLLSYLGEESVYMLVIPAFYWCIHRTIGVRLLVFLLVSTATNEVGKMLLHGPRPYWFDPRVLGLYSETSFGVPSGHAQNGLGFWTYLALLLRRRWRLGWVLPAAILLGALISFSRLALGVHFPHDLVGGWLIACVLLWAFLSYGERIALGIRTAPIAHQALVGVGAAALLLLSGLAASSLGAERPISAVWLENAARAHTALGKSGLLPHPYGLKTILSVTGTMLGLGIGLPLAQRYAAFATDGSPTVRVARFAVGTVTLFLLQIGLAILLPKEGAAGYDILRVLRYALVGAWAVFGAPLLFLKMGLAQADTGRSE